MREVGERHKRLDLKVGFACNNNCLFCVIADKRGQGNKTTERIISDLRLGLKDGCQGVVFTGGEPTIRGDILTVVNQANRLGYAMIQIQTNGRMLGYHKFCEKIIDAGATEFSPAVHGPNPRVHEFLTSSKGSFKQTVGGIKNLVGMGQKVITNTVITQQNYRYLPKIAELLITCGVEQFQFAFVHANGNAFKNFDLIVPYKSRIKPFVHQALEIAKQAGVRAMVEAYPLCFMEGYESFCSEFYIPETEIREVDRIDLDFTATRKRAGKSKGPPCTRCIQDKICEGPWKEYPLKRGWSEFKPVKKTSLLPRA